MTLVGCFVTPHPPIIVPEVGGAQLRDAEPTVEAMREAGRRAAELAPETIVLLSPHAAMASHQMGVSLAASYKGSLAHFRAPEVRLELAGDPMLAEEILARAKRHGIPVVATASRAEAVELDWGALVPLLYLTEGLTGPCTLVLLSFSQLSCEEHRRFGGVVGRAILETPQRVLYVASADLSHRLMPGAPAGFDPRGEQFDRAITEFFGSGDWDGLMSISPSITAAAGECGYRSLAVLSGVAAAAEAVGAATRNQVLSYEGPFGVGYLVGEVQVGQTSQTQGAGE